MTASLALCLALSSAGGRMEDAQPAQPVSTVPDLSILIARQLPLAWQAPAVVALDMLVPMVLAPPAALLGGLVGGAVFGMHRSASGVTVKPAPGVGGMLLGSLLASGAVMLMADLAISTFHLSRVGPGRMVGALILMGPVVGALLLGVALQAAPRSNTLLLTGVVFGTLLMGYAAFLLAPVAALASWMVRTSADQQAGSVMWTPAGE